jgi:2-keto-3-deoxy-L-rhamnonate aldolase RhmA
MKANRFKQRLAGRKGPIGHMFFEFNTRGMAQIMEAVGIDIAVIDMEHSSWSL